MYVFDYQIHNSQSGRVYRKEYQSTLDLAVNERFNIQKLSLIARDLLTKMIIYILYTL